MRRLVPAVVALVAAGPAAAAAADCDAAGSTVEINQCLDRELALADARLNEAYRGALARIAATAEIEGKIRREWREALQEAQRKWIAFRDADCRGPVAYAWYGGTGATAAVLVCLIDKTATRAEELKRYDKK